MRRRWVSCELLESTFSQFTLARLRKVVNGEDPGGITSVKGVRIAAEGTRLPQGVSPDDAAKFASVLNKLIADDDELKGDAAIKALKKLAKTQREPDALNWRGGGGFQVARLAPACFDYSPELGRVMLRPEATGEVLVHSVCANLGFERACTSERWGEFDHTYFEGIRGSVVLKVWEGIATPELIDWLVSRLRGGQTMVLAALGVQDGAREHLRRAARGSRIALIPDDIFFTMALEGGAHE